MTPANENADWGLGLLWAAASAAGFALGAAAFHNSGKLSGVFPDDLAPVLSLGLYPFVATLPGFLHWLILRRQFPDAGWWVLASGAGSLVGYLVTGWGLGVADTRGGTAFARVAVPASLALAGAAVGTLQWAVLRRWVGHAGWWVPASSLAWAVAGYAYLRITRGNDVHTLLGGAVSGALSGAVMGLTLVVLLREGGRALARQAEQMRVSGVLGLEGGD